MLSSLASDVSMQSHALAVIGFKIPCSLATLMSVRAARLVYLNLSSQRESARETESDRRLCRERESARERERESMCVRACVCLREREGEVYVCESPKELCSLLCC
jgi:hypothetical protein